MNQPEHHFFEFGPFRLDAGEGVLTRRGEPVHLTPKALKLLLVLVQNGNHIVEKDELMKQVWPDTVVEETNLAGNIHGLRQVLGEGNGEEKYIETIPKRGYRFVSRVREVRGETEETERDETAFVASAETPPASTMMASPSAQQVRKGRVLRLLGAVVAICGLTGAALSLWVWSKPKASTRPGPITSIAVLPLKNLSGDPAQEYFADGMTQAMITELAKIGALRVISRTSIMQYRDATKPIPQIARELNVDAVLEGSVLRSNDRVRITAQLIRGTTDEHLWAESYERDLNDVLALQREIASDIVGEIRIKLTPHEQDRLGNARPINPAAHEAYLKGLYYLNQAIDEPLPEEGERLHRKSFEYFEQAIKLDPDYALPYQGLASSYHFLASSGQPQYYPKAKEKAVKALALDDTLADAHGSLAFVIWRDEWDFAGAEREFRKSQALNPNSCNWGYAQFLSTTGRHDEAIRQIRLAQDRDPLTLLLKTNVGWIYCDAGQYNDAIEQFRSVLELDPDNPWVHAGLGRAFVLKGEYQQGIAECQTAVNLSGKMPVMRAELAWAYAMAGRRSDAIKIFDDLKGSSQEQISPWRKAVIHAALGEKDLALAQLELSYARKSEGLLWLKSEPTFDGLRSDPRFIDLVRRVGFPE